MVKALAALGLAASSWLAMAASPPGWRIPGSFEPVEAVWLGFDAGHADWTAQLVQALTPHARIRMLVPTDDAAQRARATLFDHGVDIERLQVHVDAQAMFFVQDAAVFATGPGGQRGVVDFVDSHYGLAAWCAGRHPGDDSRAAECAGSAQPPRDGLGRAIAAFAQARVFDSALALEGGGVEVNGQGVMIANEALLRTRNPQWSREEMELALLALPGMRKVIWLPDGLAEDPHLRGTIVGQRVGWGTGGHTDQFVRFADERTVLLAWVEPAQAALHPVARLNRQRMQRNFEILSRTSDADGRPLKVVKVPMPRPIERAVVLRDDADPRLSEQWRADGFAPGEGRRTGQSLWQVADASYLNCVAVNGVVVLPDYAAHGTPSSRQRQVRAQFEGAFPGRSIGFVDSLGANWYGGGPHCATLSEPAGR
jgi:agmatine deiminase